MESREEILKELREIAPALSALQKAHPYTVPADYFTHFTERILLQVTTAGAVPGTELGTIAPALQQLSKTEPALPADYFNTFSSKLLHKIRVSEISNELLAIAPALSKIEKVNVYQAPGGYFTALPQQLLQAIGQVRPPVPVPASPQWVIALNNALDSLVSLVFKPKYSVAFAGLATSIVLAVMLYMGSPAKPTLDARFAALTNAELDTYFANNSDEYGSVLDASTDDNTLLNSSTKNSIAPFIKEEITDEDLENILL